MATNNNDNKFVVSVLFSIVVDLGFFCSLQLFRKGRPTISEGILGYIVWPCRPLLYGKGLLENKWRKNAHFVSPESRFNMDRSSLCGLLNCDYQIIYYEKEFNSNDLISLINSTAL